jgi:hypothetical protein
MQKQMQTRGTKSKSLYQEQSFQYQMECLKIEINLVDSAISRMESITQTVKNFAIVTWAGGITLIMGMSELRRYVIFITALPILFWLLDAWWVHLNRGASLRLKKISEFINSERLCESFKLQQLIDFTILDVLGSQYKGTKEYYAYTGFGKVFRYREFVLLYGGLVIISLVIGIIGLVIW